jgi:flagellar hook-associated protein 1 FlgK
MAGGTQTVEEFHAEVLYSIGAETSRAESALEARDSLVQALDKQYTDEAGVSLDEEAVDVMRYQQAYLAAARLVEVANEMFDRLMELT